MSNLPPTAPPPTPPSGHRASACQPRHAVHDLRNLLGQIQGYAEVLQHRESGGEGGRELQAIRVACQRASDLCADLMRFGQDGWEPEAEPFDPAGLLNSVEELFVDRRTPSGVRLDFRAESGLPPVQGDRRLVERALLNLVWNAIAVVDPAGGRLEVRVERAPGGAVRFCVRDNGPGLPEQLACELTHHRRGAADWSRSADGSLHGFGLLIVALVARLHGGRLLAANRSEGGAELSLDLPVQG